VCHDVAPVGRPNIRSTIRLGLIFVLGPVQCRIAPRIPVDRIVRMLQQVRAGSPRRGDCAAIFTGWELLVGRMLFTIAEDLSMSDSGIAAQLPVLRPQAQ